MRFDLLDEYSALVPFGLGVSRKRPRQDPAMPVKVAERSTIANFASRLQVLHKILRTPGQLLFASCRNLVLKYSRLF